MKFDPVVDYQKTILKKSGVFLRNTDRVLDVGCGRGDNSVMFAKYAKKVVGIDIEPWKDWKRLKTKKVSFRRADGEKLPFATNTFDVVFTKDTLHHVQNVVRVLKEMRRVTKRNGRIYIVESNRYNPIFYVHMTKMLGHEHFTTRALASLLSAVFEKITYRRAETRVYPVRSAFLHRIFHVAERVIEFCPVVNRFSTYNIAEIINTK